MQITQELREYARERGLDHQAALEAGLQDKSQQFRQASEGIYP